MVEVDAVMPVFHDGLYGANLRVVWEHASFDHRMNSVWLFSANGDQARPCVSVFADKKSKDGERRRHLWMASSRKWMYRRTEPQ